MLSKTSNHFVQKDVELESAMILKHETWGQVKLYVLIFPHKLVNKKHSHLFKPMDIWTTYTAA